VKRLAIGNEVSDGWMWDRTVPGNNDHDFYIDTTTTDILVHNTCGEDEEDESSQGGCLVGVLATGPDCGDRKGVQSVAERQRLVAAVQYVSCPESRSCDVLEEAQAAEVAGVDGLGSEAINRLYELADSSVS